MKQPFIRLQLFPHSDVPLHQQTSRNKPFLFNPVEHDIVLGTVLRVGRKVDRSYNAASGASPATRDSKPTTREQRAANNVSLSSDPLQAGFVVTPAVASNPATVSPDPASPTRLQSDSSSVQQDSTANSLYVAFRSKVVSRTHAEIWVGRDGQIYLKDIGSSSGTFLNRLRLSPSGKESRPYLLKSGDVIQLGVDYQGRSEEIYKAVIIKVFITMKNGLQTRASPQRLRTALSSLISAMNPNNTDHDTPTRPTDCCICLGPMAPLQALFLSPCSHCFHYKCVTPLLGTGYMFQCPMCRQVANLDASTATEMDDASIIIEHEQHLIHGLSESTSDAFAINSTSDLTSNMYAAPSSSSVIDHEGTSSSNHVVGLAEDNTELEVGSPTSVHASHTLARKPKSVIAAISRSDSEFTHVATDGPSTLSNSANRASNGDSSSQDTSPNGASEATMPMTIPTRTTLNHLGHLPERFDAMSATTPPNNTMSVPLSTNVSTSGSEPATALRQAHPNSTNPLPASFSNLSSALARGDRSAANVAIDTYGKALADLLGETHNTLSNEDLKALKERLIQSLLPRQHE